jgi:hypothetical protein
MTVTTSKITCPADIYTEIATAAVNVSFRVKTMVKTTQVRMANAASLPAPTATDFVAVSDKKWKALGSLTDNLYLMPIGGDAIVEVVKG